MKDGWIDIRENTGLRRLGDIPDEANPDRPGYTLPNSWHGWTGVESGCYSLYEAAEICRRSVSQLKRIINENPDCPVRVLQKIPSWIVAFHPGSLQQWFRHEYRIEANRNKTAHLNKKKRKLIAGTLIHF